MILKKEKQKSILVLVLGFLLLSWIFDSRIFLILAFVIGIGSLLIPGFAEITLRIWFKVGAVLGWINSRILLAIVFYLVVFPMGVLYRLKTKNALQIRRTSKKTLFITRNKRYEKQDMENTW